jgi:hypothetical protein
VLPALLLRLVLLLLLADPCVLRELLPDRGVPAPSELSRDRGVTDHSEYVEVELPPELAEDIDDSDEDPGVRWRRWPPNDDSLPAARPGASIDGSSAEPPLVLALAPLPSLLLWLHWLLLRPLASIADGAGPAAGRCW